MEVKVVVGVKVVVFYSSAAGRYTIPFELRARVVCLQEALRQQHRDTAGFIQLLPDGSNTAVTEHYFLAAHSSGGHQDHWSFATAATPLAGEVSFPHKHVLRQA